MKEQQVLYAFKKYSTIKKLDGKLKDGKYQQYFIFD